MKFVQHLRINVTNFRLVLVPLKGILLPLKMQVTVCPSGVTSYCYPIKNIIIYQVDY